MIAIQPASNYLICGLIDARVVVLNSMTYEIISVLEASSKPLRILNKQYNNEAYVLVFCDKGYIDVINLS